MDQLLSTVLSSWHPAWAGCALVLQSRHEADGGGQARRRPALDHALVTGLAEFKLPYLHTMDGASKELLAQLCAAQVRRNAQHARPEHVLRRHA
ncbi:MAG TPA: hypothetical protein VI299_04785 [Polyangiales bacterium]